MVWTEKLEGIFGSGQGNRQPSAWETLAGLNSFACTLSAHLRAVIGGCLAELGCSISLCQGWAIGPYYDGPPKCERTKSGADSVRDLWVHSCGTATSACLHKSWGGNRPRWSRLEQATAPASTCKGQDWGQTRPKTHHHM